MRIIQKYPENITVLSVAYSGPEEGPLAKNVKSSKCFVIREKKANFSREIPLRAFQFSEIFANTSLF